MIERCPGCDAQLRVPARFKRGACPSCGARLQTAVRRNPAPSGWLTAAERRYQSFHGVAPRKTTSVNVKLADTWWLLGAAGAIEYEPPPNSERAPDIYRHVFGDLGGRRQRSSAQLLVSPDGKQLLILANGSGRFVTGARGIVG